VDVTFFVSAKKKVTKETDRRELINTNKNKQIVNNTRGLVPPCVFSALLLPVLSVRYAMPHLGGCCWGCLEPGFFVRY